MIKLSEKAISFEMKDRRKRKHDIDKELLYGLVCTTCNNIILASFLTDKKVDLWDYEESAILKTLGIKDIGSFNYLYPTVESEKGDSCYESTISNSPDKGTVIQTIRMKNHILQPSKIGKSPVDKYEVGERPCLYAAAASIRQDMAYKTAMALTGTSIDELNKWDWDEKLTEISQDLKAENTGFRAAKSYGPVPYFGVLIPKEKVTYGAFLWNKSKYYPTKSK